MKDYENKCNPYICDDSHINCGDIQQNLSPGLPPCLSLGWGIPKGTSPKVEHFCINASLTLFLSWCLDFLFSLSLPRRRAPPAFTGRPLMRWLLPPMMPRQLSEPHLHACYRAGKKTQEKRVNTRLRGDNSLFLKYQKRVAIIRVQRFIWNFTCSSVLKEWKL